MPPSLENELQDSPKPHLTKVENADEINNAAEGTITNNGDNSDTSKNSASEDGPALPKGSVSEIKSVVQRGDDIVEREEYLISLNKKHYASYALVAKQIYKDFNLVKTIVEINSPHILAALKQIVTYFPEEPLDFGNQVSYESPFKLLNQHRVEIKARLDAEKDGEAQSHLRLLLSFLDNEAGDSGPQLERLLKSNLVTFEHLWAVFKPGDLLIKREYGHERLYRLQKTGYQDSCTSRGKFLELSCEYSSCDGEKVGCSTVNIQIWEKQEFVGKSPTFITALSVSPLKFHTGSMNTEGLKERLSKRGEKYLQIRGARCFNYEGLYVYLKTPPLNHYDERMEYDGIWLPRSGAGRVVVDCKTFVEEMRAQKEEFSHWVSMFRGTDDKGTQNSNNVAREVGNVDPMLCPPYVYGFNLTVKYWCKFFVESLSTFEWRPNAMDSLILPGNERKLISSLVGAHKFPDHARDESTQKGNGLIILLHGEPGTGKTLTAELVAEHCKRPLLKISTGELGAWGDQIAQELKEKLEYAAIWKAVVLIDEADVFLEARRTGSHDTKHNNKVALFLKQLEYYQGILFLTSNRVDVFDRAIRSRIHLALQYQSPTPDRRKIMWRQQLASVHTNEIAIDDVEACLGRISGPDMNGREIANAVNTALTLASSEQSKLKLEHLEMVIKVWEDFHESLHGMEQKVSKNERSIV